MFYDWYLGLTNGYWQYFMNYWPKHSAIEFGSSASIRDMINQAKVFYSLNKGKPHEEIIAELSNLPRLNHPRRRSSLFLIWASPLERRMHQLTIPSRVVLYFGMIGVSYVLGRYKWRLFSAIRGAFL